MSEITRGKCLRVSECSFIKYTGNNTWDFDSHGIRYTGNSPTGIDVYNGANRNWMGMDLGDYLVIYDNGSEVADLEVFTSQEFNSNFVVSPARLDVLYEDENSTCVVRYGNGHLDVLTQEEMGDYVPVYKSRAVEITVMNITFLYFGQNGNGLHLIKDDMGYRLLKCADVVESFGENTLLDMAKWDRTCIKS